MLPSVWKAVHHRWCKGAAVLATIVIALLGVSAGHAARKEARGTVSGAVTGPAGEVLAGVAITLVAADKPPSTATTDKRGKFSLTVAAGDYLMGLEKEGYAPFEASLSVEADGRQVVTVQLLDAAAGRRNAAVEAYNAGAAAFKAGDKAAAKASFLAAVEADPSLVEPHRPLADIYLDEGAWAEAAAAAETYLAARPDDRQAQLIAYEAYRKLGDRERVGEMRRTLAADPRLASKLAVQAYNEGAAADQRGDPETAAEKFREALDLDPGMAAARFALATAEYRRERWTEALAAVEEGLTHEPTNVQGLRLRYLIHDVLADHDAAGEAIEAYAEVDAAAAADLLFKRAELDFQDGETETARAALSKILEFEPDHASAHRILGLAYLTTDTTLAKKHLQRFLELAPDDPEAATVEEILGSLE